MPEKNHLFPATAMPDSEWWEALWPDPLSVLEKVGIEQGMIAIDLCCGDGMFSVPMSKLLDGLVYGIDIDPQMLSIAKQAIIDSGAPKIRLIEGDATDLVNLVAKKVDAVLIANTFHGVPDQAAMAKSVFDILKPNGRFIVINWHTKPREETTVLGKPRGPRNDLRMSPNDVREIIDRSGLVFEKVIELKPYHYGSIFKKPISTIQA